MNIQTIILVGVGLLTLAVGLQVSSSMFLYRADEDWNSVYYDDDMDYDKKQTRLRDIEHERNLANALAAPSTVVAYSGIGMFLLAIGLILREKKTSFALYADPRHQSPAREYDLPENPRPPVQ